MSYHKISDDLMSDDDQFILDVISDDISYHKISDDLIAYDLQISE